MTVVVGQLRTSAAPPVAQELHAWVLRSSEELRSLRSALQQALTGHPLLAGQQLGDIAERMVLVATELATNAIKYGRPPTVIRLLCRDDQLILDVADHDLQTFPELADTRPVGAGGRGLMLAQSFSLEVGWCTGENTEHVWATFPAHS